MKLANRILIAMIAGILLGLAFGSGSLLFKQNALYIPEGTPIYTDKNLKDNVVIKKEIFARKYHLIEEINQSGKIYSFEITADESQALTIILTEEGHSKRLYVPAKGLSLVWVAGYHLNRFIHPFGILFLKLIKMIVIPLVMVSLIFGIASMEDIRKLRIDGIKALVYFVFTTLVAITIGVTLADLIKPGSGLNASGMPQAEITLETSGGSFGDSLLAMVPDNLFASMAKSDMLPILVFSVVFGVALSTLPASKEKSAFLSVLDTLNMVILKIIDFVMIYAPVGVFALIFYAASKYGYHFFSSVFFYIITVLLGFLMHLLLVYGFSLRVLSKKPFGSFLKTVFPVQLIAFATSSSSATLPVSMEVTEKELNVPKDTTGFILPLGATINMDGTALYQGVAGVFIAQMYGIDLTISQQISIILTATIASIGTAGVPGVGIVMLTMVLDSVGLPLSGIGIILGVDRILDMFRTALNVTGDMAAAVYISKSG